MNMAVGPKGARKGSSRPGRAGSTSASDLREICDLLSGLIRIPSVNSGNAPAEREGDAERLFEISEFVCTWLKDRGVSARIREFKKDYPVVMAKAGKGKRRVMLNGHTDVVPAGGREDWKHDPFSGRISAGSVFGRGAADMKGGLAVQMHAMCKLADRTDCAMTLSAVSDEETGGFHGTRHVASRYGADIALVAEPTSGMVMLGEKGNLAVDLVTLGKAAHASRPSLGSNAIMLMFEKLNSLSAITGTSAHVSASMRKVLKDTESVFGEEVTRVTFSPNKINGGVKSNVVPDRCEAVIDFRPPVGMSIAETFRRVQELAGADCVKVHEAAEPNYTEPEDEFVAEFIASFGKVAGSPRQVIFPAASDGRHFRSRGVPTLLYGPGNLDVIHSCNEHVSLADLALAHRVYCGFLSGFGRMD